MFKPQSPEDSRGEPCNLYTTTYSTQNAEESIAVLNHRASADVRSCGAGRLHPPVRAVSNASLNENANVEGPTSIESGVAENRRSTTDRAHCRMA